MSRAIQWTCDGCDMQVLIEAGNGTPPAWAADMEVSVSHFEALSLPSNMKARYDLCSSCQQYLYARIDARSWPRLKREVAS